VKPCSGRLARLCRYFNVATLQSRPLVVDSLLENVNKPANNVTLSIGVISHVVVGAAAVAWVHSIQFNLFPDRIS